MSESEQEKVSESQIAVHWREEEYIYPPESFVAQANANDPAIYDRFDEKNFPDCFTEYADLLAWDKKWDTVLDSSNPPFWKWFTGGRLNASYNCVDRHLAERGSKAAMIFVSEPEDEEPVAVTYRELYNQVNEFAALLRDFAGLKAGDRVTLHMPMVPELPVTMLACARLGVIHSQVFGGFSGNAAGTRIADSGSRVLITMDGYWRSGCHGGPQGQGGRGAGRGGPAGPGGGQGPGLAAVPGPVRLADADDRGPRLLRGRGAAAVPAADRRAGVHAGRGTAVPDVHQRHHRPPQGSPAQHRRATCPT